MGLFGKKGEKTESMGFVGKQVNAHAQEAVEDKVADVVAEKTLDYALENAGSTFLPWWAMILWWPIKQIALLITWPIRLLFRKKK
jgi:hypothetical protein